MTTLGELKARVILETNRDDLDAGGKYARYFAGLRPGTQGFGLRYTAVAKRMSDQLNADEEAFADRAIVSPAVAYARKHGFPIDDPGVAQTIRAIAVQHSPRGWKHIIDSVVAAGAQNGDPAAVIHQTFLQRARYVRSLHQMPEDIRRGVLDRYGKEEQNYMALTRQHENPR